MYYPGPGISRVLLDIPPIGLFSYPKPVPRAVEPLKLPVASMLAKPMELYCPGPGAKPAYLSRYDYVLMPKVKAMLFFTAPES